MKEPCPQGEKLEERIESNEKLSNMRDEENERQLQNLINTVHKIDQGNISKMKLLNRKIDNLKEEMNEKLENMENRFIDKIDSSIEKSFGKLTNYLKWTAIGLGIIILIVALIFGGQYGVIFFKWIVGFLV